MATSAREPRPKAREDGHAAKTRPPHPFRQAPRETPGSGLEPCRACAPAEPCGQCAAGRKAVSGSPLRLKPGPGAAPTTEAAVQRAGYLDRRLGPPEAIQVGGVADPQEAAADQVADAAMRARRLDAPTPPPDAPADGAGGLKPEIRAPIEQALGRDMSHVKVLDDAPARSAAAALGARAFARNDQIWLGPGESPRDLRLMAHEAAHLAQADAAPGAPLRRQVPDGVCQAPDAGGYSFIGPEPAPAAPSTLPSQVEVSSAPMSGVSAAPVTIQLEEPILSSTAITYYAIPLALTDGAGGSGGAPVCRPRDRDDAGTSGATSSPSTSPHSLPYAAPFSMPVSIDGVALEVVRVTDTFVIVSNYHHLAVGAGATTILETAQGVRLIDAGVGTDGGSDISAAIADRVSGILNGHPIAEVMITHLHADHTSLLPELARRFPIGRLRVNALQFADPRFRQLLAQIATAQTDGVTRRAGAAFDAQRSAWESTEGSRIADVAAREAAFQIARSASIATQLRNLAANPTQVDLLVPDGGRLVATSAPLGALPALGPADANPVVQGLRREGGPGEVSDTSFVDRGTGRHLQRQQAAAASDPTARVPDEVVDTASTNYVIDLPGGNRLMVVPDVRTDDLRRSLDGTRAGRSALERALAEIGHPARFQAWNMTHHMQSGWVADGAPHVAGAAELNNFVRMVQNIRDIQRAQRAAAGTPGGAAPADMVVVSAQHDALTRSMVNPGMVWFLRSLGFEVFLAASQRDIRLIEATTAGGQKVSGVSGLPAEGLRPTDPLLMHAEEALRNLREQFEVAKRRSAPGPGKKARDAARRVAIEQVKTARNAIITARDAYIRVASDTLWRGAHDSTRPSVAPDPAQPLPEAMAAAEARLRTALQTPLLSEFTPSRPSATPVISDTALVVLRQQAGSTIDAPARSMLESVQRADALRVRMQAADAPPALRADLAAELGVYRGLLEAQRATAPEASRPVLEEELLHTDRELRSLMNTGEGEVVFSREPGTGRLVENRVVVVPGAGPTAADRVRGAAETAGRPLGALMVFQTIRGEATLLEAQATGRATTAQTLVGSVHSAGNVAIGVRMMQAQPVSPGVFVVMSVLNVTQTALGDYDTDAQRAQSVAHSAIEESVTLGLMALSQVMMRSGNPYVVGAGFGIMFLTGPIMSLLERAGVFDAIERVTEFLPSEVTAATQHLRPLITDYTALIGAMELARREPAELRSMGAADPEAVRSSATTDIAGYRARVVAKEAELLTAFDAAYTRAAGDYAGLYELDTLRRQFLEMRVEAHRGDDRNTESARTALAAFARIDTGLSMDQMTADQINGLPQWSRLDTELTELSDLLSASHVDWESVRQKETEVEQVMRNARYRLYPQQHGLRSTPMLSPGAPGREAYEIKLCDAESRLTVLESRMMRVGQAGGADATLAMDDGAMTPAVIEAALAAYTQALADAPPHPDPIALYRDTGAIDSYRVFVRDHDDYAAYLERLRAMETGLQSMFARLPRTPQSEEAPIGGASPLPLRVQAAISRRSQQLGLVFLPELDTLNAAGHERDIHRVAGLLGEPESVHPLTANEQAALASGDLEDQAGQMTTITNQLQKIEGLHASDDPQSVVGGVYRVEGSIDEIDLLIVSIPRGYVSASDNVLVGIQPGSEREFFTGGGHQRAVQAVPLNAAAVRRLGSGGRTLFRSQLRSVTLAELQAAQPAAAATPAPTSEDTVPAR
ncbi:hypothetical protein SGCZBJ_16735 [Caulobacter zeae]|uniref:DUF4157 domain-containing protein n=1 Tax=Caulobacter zeae TaxID=2055137 RepID=A0A2N5DAB6_9CAUL|nr:DUF4157 domain-containing protein [Caulobacter zeae]PLR23000.1 hypothetical protein SGCZBJ_16735 [Caulobacter zeae]